MRKRTGNFWEKLNWTGLIVLGVVFVNLKRVFIDFDVDYEYAIAQSYRMARGDHLIAQMWEPHQTSAFLNAIFIKLYLAAAGTTTGIALYLNAVGLLAKLGVAYAAYRALRKYCDRDALFLACAFFMTVNAKNFIVLDFSNMMVYFSVLLFCCLFTYLQGGSEKAGKIYLILAAACFCMEVLSYPSAIILFPLLLAVLCRHCAERGKDMALFSGVCVLIGGAFLLSVIAPTGWERFLVSAKYIVTGDGAHQVSKFANQFRDYAEEAGSLAVLFFLCGLAAFLIGRALEKKGVSRTKFSYAELFLAVLLAYNFVQISIDVTENGFHVIFRLLYVAAYLPILFWAHRLKRYANREERMAFQIGMTVSVGSGVAVLFLTNLTLLTTVAYLTLGVMVSILLIGGALRRERPEDKRVRAYGILILFLFLTIFKNIYVIRPGNRLHATIWSVRNRITDGPMAGIFSDYMGAYIRNANLEDWRQHVRPGDKILIVSDRASTIGYLYEDTEICVDSTISTPTYSGKLLSYWELNPWKEPNVVILECWYGEPRISEEAWIMGWIGEHFDSYVDGKYVRIYRRGLDPAEANTEGR